MQINRKLLEQATQSGIVESHQAEALWQFLSAHSKNSPTFRFTHILYYLGGLIAIGAMTLFMSVGWEHFGGLGLFSISLAYAAAGLFATRYFIARQLMIPAGITAAFVVALTPLAVYGMQVNLDFWADGRVYHDYHVYIDWRWMIMEFATLIVGVILIWLYRLPFMVMPIAVTLWYMSMDLVPFIYGEPDWSWELRRFFSMWFGLIMVLVAFWVDLRSRQEKDYAFWLYLFGVLAFWCGLSSMNSDSELNKFIYLCINLGMIIIGAILSRRVFTVFGSLGVAGYFGHLAYDVFRNSVLFPFALTFIGFALIYLGLVWQKREALITEKLQSLLPQPLRELIKNRHDFS